MSETAAIVAAAAGTVSAGTQVLQYISNRASSSDVNGIRDELNKSVGNLNARMEDYKKEVERHDMKEQSEIFKQWIKNVEEIEDQVNKLMVNYEKESMKSSSNCSEEMKKKLDEVIKLLEYGIQIKDELMVEQQPKPVVKKKAPYIENIEMFQEKLKDVLGSLRNDKISRIGINGRIGVGKTAIMLNLNNHNEVAELFEIVIWVDVSKTDGKKNQGIKDLQRDILKRLNKESTEDANTNASRISMALQDKKYLLLLDDVKENLNLDKIGIPDGKNGSKVVLTTRYHEVCSLLVHKVVNVTELSEKDALELFQDILQDSEFLKSAEHYYRTLQVLENCHYIPQVIEQLAKTIKKQKAKNSSSILNLGCNWQLFQEKESKNCIEAHYKLLTGFYYAQLDDVQKECFHFGALYPEGSNIYIDHLMECFATVYFHGNGYEKASGACDTLRHLVDLSLLEESIENYVTMQKTVTMRRFIRKMALYSALSEYPECNYLVKTNEELQKPPDAESWRNKHHISLSQNILDHLPDSPECSDLSTLFLQENLYLKEIPALFFNRMKRLQILDLCQTGIEFLPSCLSDLIYLKVLYLRDCEFLKQLHSEIKLPLLEVLDIRGSEIHNILTHVDLEHLRRLWISFEKYIVENGTQEVRLSQLSALEELVIHMESFDQWNDNVLVGGIIKQVASLEKLRSLKFCFPDKRIVVDVIKVETMLEVHVSHVDILQIFIKESCLWRKFNHKKPFLLFIGCQISGNPQIPVTLGYKKYIKYCNGEGTNPPIPETLANVQAFELIDHKHIGQLSDFVTDDCALSNLQHLYLKNLSNLRNIWSEPGEGGSLTKLKTLVLSGCPMLTTIFPAMIIKQLHDMESLTVEDCSGVVEIFEKLENDANSQNQLPNLKEMVLNEMPNLRNIWANESSRCQSLKKLTLVNCPGINGDSVQINAPNLESFVQQ